MFNPGLNNAMNGSWKNFLLEEYTVMGKKIDWMKFHFMIDDASMRDQHLFDSLRQIKFLQERDRALEIINNEKDPVTKKHMQEMFEYGNLALDNAFFGKKVHRYLV